MLKTFDSVNKTSSSFGISIFLTISISFIILTSIILKSNWNFITKFIKKSNRIFTLFKISLVIQNLSISIDCTFEFPNNFLALLLYEYTNGFPFW